MLKYGISRLFQTFIVLVGVSLIVFLLLHLIPGDPVKILLGPRASEQTRTALSQELGLNKPLYQQYFSYMGRLFKGDLGNSYRYKEPVASLLLEALPKTFQLAFLVVLIELVFGVAAAVVSYLSKRRFIDIFFIVSASFFISVPAFWLAMVLQYWLGFKWQIFPPLGADSWTSIVLPAITLSFISTAIILRILRASLKEEASKDYILLARAKGLTPRKILFKHQLKNAFMPTLTYLGMDFGTLMTGAIATEIVFNWPGVGLLIYHAVMARDIPVILSGVLVLVAIYVGVNLVVDMLYGFFNPLVRENI